MLNEGAVWRCHREFFSPRKEKFTRNMTKSLEAAASIIRESQSVVAFSGAGISTESGIPDFRSKGGLWDRYDPDIYANYQVFLRQPELYWQMEAEMSADLKKAEPNPAHYALVKLERRGKLKAIITQNVDRLHRRSGSAVPIFELHGSAETAGCVDCGKQYPGDEILEKVWGGDPSPTCSVCGGLVKPNVVLFGESLNSETVRGAFDFASSCDCLLVIGSSLVVAPANQIPILAKSRGAAVIFINREPTILDELADVILRGSAGDILTQLVELI
jgi:NAD-dependent deacetylase